MTYRSLTSAEARAKVGARVRVAVRVIDSSAVEVVWGRSGSRPPWVDWVAKAEDEARVIGDALAGHLYGWCGRDTHLDVRVSQAQAALNLRAGGSGEPVMPQRPTGTVLPVVAIVQMVAGVLGVPLEAR
jgi:hypothetical protein